MRWEISTQVPLNSFQYFEKTIIAPNGFREYDLRWLLGKEINPNGFVVMGRSYGTYLRRVMGKSQAVVGHDFRAYSQNLSFAFIVGLLSSGVLPLPGIPEPPENPDQVADRIRSEADFDGGGGTGKDRGIRL